MKPSKEFSILYVDDEAANLRSFKAAFRRIYKVHVAKDPIEGMKIVERNDLNAVVSDHKMPHLVGTAFLRDVYRYDKNIRRVILSGFVSKEELIAANTAYGLHAYISKPWDFDNVHTILQRLLTVDEAPTLNYK